MSQPDQPDSSADFVRSKESLDFEQMWRALPRKGHLPERRSFHPRLAKSWLNRLIVLHSPTAEDPAIRVGLVGDAIRQQIAREIVGEDYLSFLDTPERRTRTVEFWHEMFERPYGVWWVAPVHYERGFSQHWELTAFPLAGNEPAKGVMLLLVRPLGALFGDGGDQKAIRVGVPAQVEVIDIDR